MFKKIKLFFYQKNLKKDFYYSFYKTDDERQTYYIINDKGKIPFENLRLIKAIELKNELIKKKPKEEFTIERELCFF